VIRVVVAEDNYLVREALTRLLGTDDEIEVVGVCEDFDALLAMVAELEPDVALTDIRMPPTGTDEGVRAAKQLRASHPQIGVVVLSQYVEPTYALELLEGGSERRAYLLKERVSDVEQLSRAIREVSAGGSVIDPKVVEALVAARARTKDSPIDRLTPARARSPRGDGSGPQQRVGRGRARALGARGEKHINSVFSKLDLSEEPDVHRRVKAVLLYLADGPPAPA
jgi:DNA-binding NarL/FixJ family response regulator